jgi:hypothetical protein
MARSGGRIGAMVGAIAMAGPAAAAGVAPLDGAYGNEPGCHFYFTGRPGAEMVLVTPYTALFQPTGCVFKSAVEIDDAIVISGRCSNEGEDTVTSGEVLKLRLADGQLTIIDGLELMGPFLRCVNDDAVTA